MAKHLRDVVVSARDKDFNLLENFYAIRATLRQSQPLLCCFIIETLLSQNLNQPPPFTIGCCQIDDLPLILFQLRTVVFLFGKRPEFFQQVDIL